MLSAGLVALIVLAGCERSVNGLSEPGLSQEPNIFTDTFIGMGSNFYFPFETARPDVFSVDEDEGFESNASIRIDVPNANDPSGNFAGAIFRVDGAGRDLSGYDALTFYARTSQGVNIGEVGFGLDFINDTYQVSTSNLSVGTNWTKYVIPIPDPSRLVDERGVFWISAGSQETGGFGYTFWVDELRFEKLGTIAQPRPAILGSSDQEITTFIGASTNITGLSHTVNYAVESASGEVVARDITLNTAPSYFTFNTSDASVATVNELGAVSIVGSGTATITASLDGQSAAGSLEVESLGELPASPVPPQSSENVKSVFSDSYNAETTSNFSPGFGGSTTQTSVLTTNNGSFLSYTDNNFTGVIFNNTIDGSEMTFLHVDVYVLDASTSIGLQIRDVGPNGILETNVFNGFPEGDDVDYRVTLDGFEVGVWKSFNIPLLGDIASQKDNLGALILTGGPNFILDNIYFYK